MEEPLTLGLLLIPLLSGFILLWLLPYSRFYIAELEHHGLFIYSAAVGALLLCASRLIVIIAAHVAPLTVECLRQKLVSYAPIPHPGTFVGVFILGAGIGLVGMLADSSRRALYRSAAHADALLRFLLEALTCPPETGRTGE